MGSVRLRVLHGLLRDKYKKTGFRNITFPKPRSGEVPSRFELLYAVLQTGA